jgi:hypothetical protein
MPGCVRRGRGGARNLLRGFKLSQGYTVVLWLPSPNDHGLTICEPCSVWEIPLRMRRAHSMSSASAPASGPHNLRLVCARESARTARNLRLRFNGGGLLATPHGMCVAGSGSGVVVPLSTGMEGAHLPLSLFCKIQQHGSEPGTCPDRRVFPA